MQPDHHDCHLDDEDDSENEYDCGDDNQFFYFVDADKHLPLLFISDEQGFFLLPMPLLALFSEKCKNNWERNMYVLEI